MKPSRLFYFFLLLIALSCQEENALIKTDPAIEKAKNWFALNEETLSSAGRNDPSARGRAARFNKQPDWEKSKVHNTKNGGQAVEVVLDYDNYLIPSNENPGSVRANVINSMLLFETKQGEYKIYLLKIYPENISTELSKNDFNILNYGNIPHNFSGQVMVFDWSENFIGGWEVSDGKKTRHIVRTKNGKAQNEPNTKGRKLGGCYLHITDWYISVCTEDGSYCTDWSLFDSDSYLHCDYIAPQAPQAPDGSGGGGGGGNSGGGGSGGGGGGDCLTPDEFIQELMVPCDMVPIVENNMVTPCLYDQVEVMRASSVQSKIQQIFMNVFENDTQTTMYQFTESNNPTYTARTFLETKSPFHVRTNLNTTVLSNASREFTTIVVYHEIVHAILYYENMSESLHHSAILEAYVDELATIAISLYPNLPLKDARAIAMFGLGNIAVSAPADYNETATRFGLNSNEISEIAMSYRRDDVTGNFKKGQPCGN